MCLLKKFRAISGVHNPPRHMGQLAKLRRRQFTEDGVVYSLEGWGEVDQRADASLSQSQKNAATVGWVYALCYKPGALQRAGLVCHQGRGNAQMLSDSTGAYPLFALEVGNGHEDRISRPGHVELGGETAAQAV